MNKPLQYGIIGAGVVGLGMARRLRAMGHDVTIFEASPHIGGLASSWKIGEVTWDRYYHVILLSDLIVRDLLTELGIDNECHWVETKTGFYTDSQMYSMSNSMEFLKFPPMRFIDKIRLGMTISVASRIQQWKYLERIPVAKWLKRWSGQHTLDKIWIPLLKSKLGDAYEETMASFIWATIARMYAARRSGLKKEMFGYVRGGYQRILSKFENRLRDHGVKFHLNYPITQVSCESNVISVRSHEQQHNFDRLIITTNPHITAKLLPQLSSMELEKLRKLKYQGIVCASMLLKKPLDRFYVTNITDSWVPFTAVIEMGALVDRKEFAGHSLVYLPKYIAPDDDIFQENDESIQERFVTAIEKMYPHFSRSDIVAFQIAKVREVFAITTKDYSKNVLPFQSSIHNIWLVNSSQIVNGTLNVNESLNLVDRALHSIHPELSTNK